MKSSIYEPFEPYPLTQRQWPDKTLDKSPAWCSVDLSVGAHARPYPLGDEKKWQLFTLLTMIGIKHIEIGRPGHCQADFLFARRLIEANIIPDETAIQVMTQMKNKNIEQCFYAITGAKEVVMNLFHSTSALRRDSIYKAHDETAMLSQMVESMLYAKEQAKRHPDTKIHFQYSPEVFNTTEPERLLKLCLAVIEVMAPSEQAPLIINFFEAVETDTPNGFADRIEYLITSLGHLPHLTYSVRPHNDRGTAVASAELALLAGATRIEGGVLGAGPRAGTASLLTLALNLYTQGVMPGLNLDDADDIAATIEECLGEPIPKNQPYVGENAFTAFSSHEQFSIHEALNSFDEETATYWHVPYLPMNPKDIGRDNDAVIRLNHLSGRTGIAHVMKKYHGFCLPKDLQKEFALSVKEHVRNRVEEFDLDSLNALFYDIYIKQTSPLALRSISFDKDKTHLNQLYCKGKLNYLGETILFKSEGQGALNTFLKGLENVFSLNMEIDEYYQHALGHSAVSEAASYVRLRIDADKFVWGVAVDNDATLANIRALISAINRTMDMNND